MHFFREILRAPHLTGAIAPSSPFLAKAVVDHAEVAEAETILELGPGTGVVTRRILKERRPDARYLGIEKNENFLPTLRSQFPELAMVGACASELREHATNNGVASADSIISGLPWALFSDELQENILNAIQGTLADDGTFVTFAYYGPHWLPAGQAFRKQLQQIFPTVRASRVILANLPPAFIYQCRKAP